MIKKYFQILVIFSILKKTLSSRFFNFGYIGKYKHALRSLKRKQSTYHTAKNAVKARSVFWRLAALKNVCLGKIVYKKLKFRVHAKDSFSPIALEISKLK